MKHEHGIFDASGHRSQLIERPAKRHRSSARNTAEGGPQPGNSAPHAGADNAAACLASDRESDKACGSCGTGSCARTGGSFFQQPWIHGLSAEPNIVQCKGTHAELGNEYRAGIV